MKIEYDINKFAEEFKNTINWMLEDKLCGDDIKNDIKDWNKNKESLKNNKDSLDALKIIIKLIKTNGYHWPLSSDFDKKWRDFCTFHKSNNFRTKKAKEELKRLVGNANWKKKRIDELLNNYESIMDFTKKLYKLAEDGKTIILGQKGKDEYLRDVGYWKRIPMDIHEMRFIIRTGIYHACTTKDQSDPLDKNQLHKALTQFCQNYLKGYIVEGIDLGEAPGIVDIFIWSYCAKAENRYNRCGNIPNCNECKLKNVCLYALINVDKNDQL